MTDDKKVIPLGTDYHPDPRPNAEYEDLRQQIEILADEIMHLSRMVMSLTRALRKERKK